MVTWQDVVNGSFELCGGAFILLNCLTLYRHKLVRGVNVVSTVYFNLWGFWNLYYYPHLDQWASFWGGIGICAGNTLWVTLMVHYIRHPGGRKEAVAPCSP